MGGSGASDAPDASGTPGSPSSPDGLPYVDEHAAIVPAPRERVWAALESYARTLTGPQGLVHGLLTRALGTTPRAGFEVVASVPGELLRLGGRHRFSSYVLEFSLSDTHAHGTGTGGPPAPASTRVAARTYAAFPGPLGRAYRVLVIGSGGHALSVRRMLEAVRARATP